MKTMKLSDLNSGEIFNYGDVNWIKLDEVDGIVKALSENILEHGRFDPNYNNNWRKSELREYLNNEILKRLIEAGADENAFVEFESSLTSDKGLKDYGISSDKIALLTRKDYERYKEYITPANDWWWLITPYTTEEQAFLVRVASANRLTCTGSLTKSCGIRPFCHLVSSISVYEKKTYRDDRMHVNG